MSAINKELGNIELSGYLKILNSAGFLDMDKNEVRNAIIQNLGTEPASPSAGQIIYNTVKNLFGYWNGTAWVYPSIGSNFGDTNSVDLQHNGSTNTVTADVRVVSGGGIEITSNGLQLTDTGVSAGDYTKLTIDVKGRVTAATNLTSGDLPSHTHTASQVADFDTAVRTNRLDQMAVPTASLSLNSQKITNLAEPTASSDGATKNYVDTAVAGLKWKQSVKVATTANITLSGTQTIDGVALVATNRVLVKNQTTGSQNGIYVVASGAWTRATDADSITELVSAAVFVEQGTVNSDSAFTCTNDATAVLNTTAITWSIFAGTQTFTASLGVQKVGSDFRSDYNTNSLEMGTAGDANKLQVKTDTTKAIEKTAAGLAVKADGTTIEISGGALSIVPAYRLRKATTTITGTGVATAFVINHNFATDDVVIEVYELSTKLKVSVPAIRTSTNQVTIEFAIAPAASKTYRIVITG